MAMFANTPPHLLITLKPKDLRKAAVEHFLVVSLRQANSGHTETHACGTGPHTDKLWRKHRHCERKWSGVMGSVEQVNACAVKEFRKDRLTENTGTSFH